MAGGGEVALTEETEEEKDESVYVVPVEEIKQKSKQILEPKQREFLNSSRLKVKSKITGQFFCVNKVRNDHISPKGEMWSCFYIGMIFILVIDLVREKDL